MTMFCGFTMGEAMGGLSAAALIADFGWQGVLILDGALLLMRAAVLLFKFPESVRYLVLRGGHDCQQRRRRCWCWRCSGQALGIGGRK